MVETTITKKWIEFAGTDFETDINSAKRAYGLDINADEPKLYVIGDGKRYTIPFSDSGMEIFEKITQGKRYEITLNGWGPFKKVVSAMRVM